MKTCELNAFEASFTETAYWLAYFICPIPIAMFMKNTATNRELFRVITGGMWWVTVLPRCHAERILGISMHILYHCHRNVFLETAANPYVTALGDPKSAPRRLNLAQSFNGLGAFIAAMFLSKLILSGNHYTRDTLPTSFPVAGKVTFKQKQTP